MPLPFVTFKPKNMILGVAEWVSEKTGRDVSLIRIIFVVLVLVFGTGIGLYLVLWLVKLLSK